MTTQVTTTLYTFAELDEPAQQKVLNMLWDINVDSDWWYTSELDYFADYMLKEAGFDVRAKDILFSGFGNGDDGASFSGSVDPLAFMHSQHICNNLRALFCAIKSGAVSVYAQVKHANNRAYYGVVLDFESYVEDDVTQERYDKLKAQAEQLETAMLTAAEDLAHKIYTELRDCYEAQTSKESIIETIEINQYQFTQSGHWPRL